MGVNLLCQVGGRDPHRAIEKWMGEIAWTRAILPNEDSDSAFCQTTLVLVYPSGNATFKCTERDMTLDDLD